MALLVASPRHRRMSLQETNSYVTPAIALGQVAVAVVPSADQGAPIAAAAWWAFVSPEVDQRLSASRDEFLKLEMQDWRSGGQPWLIDAIGDPKVLTELIKRLIENNFSGRPAKMRAILPNGRLAIGRLEQKAATAGDARSAS